MVRQDNEQPLYKIHSVSSDSPEDLFDSLFVFHNPNAKNKLPYDLFENTSIIQVTKDENGLWFEGENLPVISRLNLLKMIYPNELRNNLMLEVFQNFNKEWLSNGNV
ncbi:MAG: hypothetical protein RL748_3339 [Pseudomonadota bacterium]|jgi:hypothetical protein